ncbi:hypothetical protein ACH5RR_025962 [Cinchona calisaya]|uniref:UBN2_2 domain-containing protein n=1 Tax=Cinchona calisaya TaxID=153742 RepID=A0ABD2Z157_9GENT
MNCLSYSLASMTNVLQKQHESLPTARNMMMNLKEMFDEQSRNARQVVMKKLLSAKMIEGTPMRMHMLNMMSFIDELGLLGTEIDFTTKTDVVLSSLPNSFN